MRLKDKTILVTGASSGIGAACAVAMAREGARVVVHYHGNEAGAVRTLERVRAAGGDGFMAKADVGVAADVRVLMAEIRARYGRLDGLVNNAGVTLKKAFAETTEEDWDWLYRTNAKSVFLCCREALDLLVPGSAIVNVSSTHALHSTSLFTVYGSSKGAVETLTRNLTLELGDRGIRINGVRPGIINVERDAIRPGDPLHDPATARIPLRRIGEVEDVTGAVVFLLSAEAAYITGQILAIDGGFAGPLSAPGPRGFSS